MKISINIKRLLFLMGTCLLASCESFLEVDVPDDKMVTETVFASDETAESAMQGIYYQLFNATFSGGTTSSISVLGGLSADLLQPVTSNNAFLVEFSENEIFTENTGVLAIWRSTYNIVYLANNLLEGIENSTGISEPVRDRLEGEALFIRAFCHFYLVNLYGDVPLVLSTDYDKNSLIPRTETSQVYEQIILDLERAREVLDEDYINNERYYVNRYAATALLARVNLYQENWNQAEELSSEVIDASSLYSLPSLNEVFLANSSEAIWQISPAGRGNILTSTNEGYTFIGSSSTSIKLNPEFVSTLDSSDLRSTSWIGHFSNENYEYDFVHKYKDRSSINNITEYATVLRLGEQYLIRAEARANLGNISGAIDDISKIRERAGIDSTSDIDPNLNLSEIMDLVMKERAKELFAEWGHRWLDLKRLENATEVLGETPTWQETDVLYPIPAEERSKNPNLGQNPGY
ncbi:RagB/SusD family nutrient uptake outer membrane protein [Autumnicola musiva]|uniref:RagB/SusD family nutrient uptake outer membrane protein n=1 Tax=Autumnicola musiva TaxID=3075589 RepID=A0ABU3D669_9FLAO|nr:RagB/SusD family nutrient uptake outer membrane protein [Zunongwangia sp. F117]MDT0677026.1 RagB/SusD family nutrient uptake outer membrane protein [Zunongwangia sp. F117]